MSVEESIKTLVRTEVRLALAEMFQADRRTEPRPALPAPRVRVRTKGRTRLARTCPVPGCKNSFAPRFGGWCKDHHGTSGYKAWAKANAKK